MRTILLDESVPIGVLKIFAGFDMMARHASELGLAGASDAHMLREAAAFDVFVTCDQNLVKQNRIDDLDFGIVVICTNNWPTILGNRDLVTSTCRGVRTANYSEVMRGSHVTRYGRSPKVIGPTD